MEFNKYLLQIAIYCSFSFCTKFSLSFLNNNDNNNNNKTVEIAKC